ncbi:arylsulfatase A isoform X1 [Procambarus clarkii]|uniref:arylsulfatase A isoform X1 n=1 Tax=Procambarus clarkii TaxID=6728 RepID=UPI0037437924
MLYVSRQLSPILLTPNIHKVSLYHYIYNLLTATAPSLEVYSTMKPVFALCLVASLVRGEVRSVRGGADTVDAQNIEINKEKLVLGERGSPEVQEEWPPGERASITTQPNIVLLLADDLGYGDLSISGHPTSRTPRLDELAEGGRFFTQFYVTSPVCSPSRASLLTGRLQVRSGVYPGTFTPDSSLGLPHNETTIAALLKDKGYRTLIVGKWHLGVGTTGEYLPTHYGFDQYLGVPYSHDMCPCKVCFPGDQPCLEQCWNQDVSCPLFSNTTVVEQPVDLTSLTGRLVERARDFIQDAAAAGSPFFLYFPFHHVHHPQFASTDHYGRSERGAFGDSLEELDWAVGQVVDQLNNLNLINSTLIWFTSDNGPSLMRKERGGCAGPLRCGKGTTWEGGVRVPAIVHWPPHITPGRCMGLASTLDVLPTLATLVDLDTSDLTLDGVDISPLLRDPLAQSPRKMYPVYPQAPTQSLGPFAVTNGTYKAHFYTLGSALSDGGNYDPMCPASHPLTPHNPPLLYNLQHDPGERYDLSNDTKYLEVLNMLTQWREEHMATVTWMEARTTVVDPMAEPCCTLPSCSPFPGCCDCPAPSRPLPSRPVNHIKGYLLQGPQPPTFWQWL